MIIFVKVPGDKLLSHQVVLVNGEYVGLIWVAKGAFQCRLNPPSLAFLGLSVTGVGRTREDAVREAITKAFTRGRVLTKFAAGLESAIEAGP